MAMILSESEQRIWSAVYELLIDEFFDAKQTSEAIVIDDTTYQTFIRKLFNDSQTSDIIIVDDTTCQQLHCHIKILRLIPFFKIYLERWKPTDLKLLNKSQNSSKKELIVATNGVGKDSVVTNGVVTNGVGKDGVDKDGVGKDGVAKDDIVKDGVADDGVVKDGMVKNGAIKDSKATVGNEKLMIKVQNLPIVSDLIGIYYLLEPPPYAIDHLYHGNILGIPRNIMINIMDKVALDIRGEHGTINFSKYTSADLGRFFLYSQDIVGEVEDRWLKERVVKKTGMAIWRNYCLEKKRTDVQSEHSIRAVASLHENDESFRRTPNSYFDIRVRVVVCLRHYNALNNPKRKSGESYEKALRLKDYISKFDFSYFIPYANDHIERIKYHIINNDIEALNDPEFFPKIIHHKVPRQRKELPFIPSPSPYSTRTPVNTVLQPLPADFYETYLPYWQNNKFAATADEVPKIIFNLFTDEDIVDFSIHKIYSKLNYKNLLSMKFKVKCHLLEWKSYESFCELALSDSEKFLSLMRRYSCRLLQERQKINGANESRKHKQIKKLTCAEKEEQYQLKARERIQKRRPFLRFLPETTIPKKGIRSDNSSRGDPNEARRNFVYYYKSGNDYSKDVILDGLRRYYDAYDFYIFSQCKILLPGCQMKELVLHFTLKTIYPLSGMIIIPIGQGIMFYDPKLEAIKKNKIPSNIMIITMYNLAEPWLVERGFQAIAADETYVKITGIWKCRPRFNKSGVKNGTTYEYFNEYPTKSGTIVELAQSINPHDEFKIVGFLDYESRIVDSLAARLTPMVCI